MVDGVGAGVGYLQGPPKGLCVSACVCVCASVSLPSFSRRRQRLNGRLCVCASVSLRSSSFLVLCSSELINILIISAPVVATTHHPLLPDTHHHLLSSLSLCPMCGRKRFWGFVHTFRVLIMLKINRAKRSDETHLLLFGSGQRTLNSCQRNSMRVTHTHTLHLFRQRDDRRATPGHFSRCLINSQLCGRSWAWGCGEPCRTVAAVKPANRVLSHS